MTKNALTVDEFIKTKVAPEQQDIVAMLRALMRDCAPDAKEQISYGILSWKVRRILAVINPAKTHTTFAFTHGAKFTDRYGLLEGAGKKSKHVKIKHMADVNQTALRDYVSQALDLDTT